MKEERYLDRIKAPHLVHMLIGRQPVRLEVNTARLDRIVRRYFEPFVTDEPDKDAMVITGIQGEPFYDVHALPKLGRISKLPKISFYDRDGVRVIHKNRSGVVHYIRGEHFYAIGDLHRYPQQLLNLVSTSYGHRLRQRGYIALHASAVTAADGAVVFCGQSGSGKSSVSLALMEFDFDYVTNDRAFIKRADDGSIKIAGVPKWPRVNPGTLLANRRLRTLLKREKREEYSQMDPRELWWVEDKHDVPVESIYGDGRLALNTKLRTMYLLNWRQRKGRMRMRAVQEGGLSELISPFFKTDVYDAPDATPVSAIDFEALLGGADIIEVTGGTNIGALIKEVAGSPSGALASSA